MLNLTEKCKYNRNLAQMNKIQKRFLCMWEDFLPSRDFCRGDDTFQTDIAILDINSSPRVFYREHIELSLLRKRNGNDVGG